MNKKLITLFLLALGSELVWAFVSGYASNNLVQFYYSDIGIFTTHAVPIVLGLISLFVYMSRFIGKKKSIISIVVAPVLSIPVIFFAAVGIIGFGKSFSLGVKISQAEYFLSASIVLVSLIVFFSALPVILCTIFWFFYRRTPHPK